MSAAMARGSIAIGLYLHDLAPARAVDRLVAQAALAEQVGFDAVTVAEHHAGFRSYLPNPLLAASWILGGTERIWSGPNPLLLPLRNVALVAEDLAWLDARFPGRVGAGLAAGYQAEDFAAVGVDGFDNRGRTYGTQLVRLAGALRGEADGLLGRDPALVAQRGRPLPLAGAAGSTVAAQRAAFAGIGLLLDSMASTAALARVAAAYAGAGGSGPRVLGRRVWVGDPPLHLFEAQLATYRRETGGTAWLQSVTPAALIGGAAGEVVDGVRRAAEAAGATVLVLRVHLPGVGPDVADEQIRRLGEEVLPGLRTAFAAPGT